MATTAIENKGKPFGRQAATPDRAARIHERNYLNQFDYEFKPITKTKYDQQIYRSNFEEKNNKTAKSEYFPYRQTSNPEHTNYRIAFNAAANQPIDHYIPMNLHNMHTYKRKMYNESAHKADNLPRARVMSPREYQSTREEMNSVAQAESKIPRTNLFISKEKMSLNKDFKAQPLIHNVQISSDDTPLWFQSANQFYTLDSMDKTKMARHSWKNQPKTDLFGSTLKNYPKQPHKFELHPPQSGMRYELNRMVVAETRPKGEPRKIAREIHNGTLKFEWKEQPQQQKYDKFKFEKVGSPERPFIKTLEHKRSNTEKPLKIGQEQVPILPKKHRPLQVGIGHPDRDNVGK